MHPVQKRERHGTSRQAVKSSSIACKSSELEDLECVSLLQYVGVRTEKYSELKLCTKKDLLDLTDTIHQGWPENRRDIPPSVQPYLDSRSQLTTYDSVVYKGVCIVVPPSMTKHMLKLIHQSHLGIVKNKRKAREVVY